MGARTKLNGANVLGAGFVAGLIGALFQSWIVFLIVFAIIAAVAMHDGSIRIQPKQPRQRK